MLRLLGLAMVVVLIGSSSISALTIIVAAPKVGAKAPDFELADLQGQKSKLSEIAAEGNVVLVVLRGFPGYQCPLCNRQTSEFIQQADKFAAAKAHVVFVYPGAAAGLVDHGKEFIAGKELPAHFHFLVDPDYTMVNAYQLRWDADKETAYPATFILDSKLKVRFAKVSKSHGGRTAAAEALKALKK